MNEFKVEELGLEFLEASAEGRAITVLVADAALENAPRCPFCGASTIKNGSRKAHYRDVPRRGSPVVLSWKRRRFQCTSLYPAVGRTKCGRIFSAPNPAMDEKRLMTARLADYIGRQSLERPFLSIAQECGIDDQTVRLVFADWSARNTVSASTAHAPRNLAILSMDILKRSRPVLADMDEETLIDILPSRDEDKLLNSLGEFSNPKDVKVVLVDLEDGFVEAAREAFPAAEVAINLEHLKRLFNEAFAEELLRIRRSLPDRLRRAVLNDPNIMHHSIRRLNGEQHAVLRYWFERLPSLEAVFTAREKFIDFVDARDRQTASSALDAWQETATSFAQTPLGRLYPLVEQRRDEVLNFSDIKTPPSFASLLPALQDAVREDSNGQAFEVRRAKLLSRAPTNSGAGQSTNLGAHIPTLVAEWKALEKKAG